MWCVVRIIEVMFLVVLMWCGGGGIHVMCVYRMVNDELV